MLVLLLTLVVPQAAAARSAPHLRVLDRNLKALMESLYESIGFPTARDGSTRHFETEAAIAVQRAVNDELGSVRATPGSMAY